MQKRIWVVLGLFFHTVVLANSMRCVSQENTSAIDASKRSFALWADEKSVAQYESWEQCERARLASSDGVVCVWFTPDMPIGPGGWEDTGWRPMHIDSGKGLGRKAIQSFDDCLLASVSAAGKIVCTYTGLGFKPTHQATNMWCGASAQLRYCAAASREARDGYVCSFPSSGTGAESGWVKTHISQSCDYQGGQSTVEVCSESLP